ncbi:MAG: tetratricopeptide repeat protein [Desulfobacterales bacterium]|nr:tetratricopeptide repeat protein [Desulfobacterales bacterium]
MVKLKQTLLTLILASSIVIWGCVTSDTATVKPAEAGGEPTVAEGLPPQSGGYYAYLVFQIQRSQGDLDRARDALEEAINKDPASGFLKRELALLLIQQARHDEALEVVEALLGSRPDDVEALIIYGRINQGMKRLALAKEAYRKVIDLDETRQDIYLLLGGLHMEAGESEAAFEVYTRLTARFPNSFAGQFYLGKLQAEQGNEEAAEKSFLRALEIKHGLEQPRFELIDLYERTGKREKIAPQFEALLENNPKDIRAAMQYGLHLHDQGRMNDAGKLFKALGHRSGEDNAVFRFLIRDFLEKKRYAEAAVVLEGMLVGSAAPSDIHYLLAVALEGQKRLDLALEHFARVKPGERFYSDAAVHIAFIYQEQGRVDEGIAFLTQVIRHLPENAEFRLFLGTFYEESKAYEKAVAALKAGLVVEPDNAKIHFRLGVVYDKWEHKDQSIQSMKEVLRIDPKHANALNYLGYTYADLGQSLDEAEDLIKRALTLMPHDGYITDSLGWVYFKRGKFEKALEYLRKAAEMVPNDPVILEHLGDAYGKLGAPEKALDVYRRSLKNKKGGTADLEKKIHDLSGSAP